MVYRPAARVPLATNKSIDHDHAIPTWLAKEGTGKTKKLADSEIVGDMNESAPKQPACKSELKDPRAWLYEDPEMIYQELPPLSMEQLASLRSSNQFPIEEPPKAIWTVDDQKRWREGDKTIKTEIASKMAFWGSLFGRIQLMHALDSTWSKKSKGGLGKSMWAPSSPNQSETVDSKLSPAVLKSVPPDQPQSSSTKTTGVAPDITGNCPQDASKLTVNAAPEISKTVCNISGSGNAEAGLGKSIWARPYQGNPTKPGTETPEKTVVVRPDPDVPPHLWGIATQKVDHAAKQTVAGVLKPKSTNTRLKPSTTEETESSKKSRADGGLQRSSWAPPSSEGQKIDESKSQKDKKTLRSHMVYRPNERGNTEIFVGEGQLPKSRKSSATVSYSSESLPSLKDKSVAEAASSTPATPQRVSSKTTESKAKLADQPIWSLPVTWGDPPQKIPDANPDEVKHNEEITSNAPGRSVRELIAVPLFMYVQAVRFDTLEGRNTPGFAEEAASYLKKGREQGEEVPSKFQHLKGDWIESEISLRIDRLVNQFLAEGIGYEQAVPAQFDYLRPLIDREVISNGGKYVPPKTYVELVRELLQQSHEVPSHLAKVKNWVQAQPLSKPPTGQAKVEGWIEGQSSLQASFPVAECKNPSPRPSKVTHRGTLSTKSSTSIVNSTKAEPLLLSSCESQSTRQSKASEKTRTEGGTPMPSKETVNEDAYISSKYLEGEVSSRASLTVTENKIFQGETKDIGATEVAARSAHNTDGCQTTSQRTGNIDGSKIAISTQPTDKASGSQIISKQPTEETESVSASSGATKATMSLSPMLRGVPSDRHAHLLKYIEDGESLLAPQSDTRIKASSHSAGKVASAANSESANKAYDVRTASLPGCKLDKRRIASQTTENASEGQSSSHSGTKMVVSSPVTSSYEIQSVKSFETSDKKLALEKLPYKKEVIQRAISLVGKGEVLPPHLSHLQEAVQVHLAARISNGAVENPLNVSPAPISYDEERSISPVEGEAASEKQGLASVPLQSSPGNTLPTKAVDINLTDSQNASNPHITPVWGCHALPTDCNLLEFALKDLSIQNQWFQNLNKALSASTDSPPEIAPGDDFVHLSDEIHKLDIPNGLVSERVDKQTPPEMDAALPPHLRAVPVPQPGKEQPSSEKQSPVQKLTGLVDLSENACAAPQSFDEGQSTNKVFGESQPLAKKIGNTGSSGAPKPPAEEIVPAASGEAAKHPTHAQQYLNTKPDIRQQNQTSQAAPAPRVTQIDHDKHLERTKGVQLISKIGEVKPKTERSGFRKGFNPDERDEDGNINVPNNPRHIWKKEPPIKLGVRMVECVPLSKLEQQLRRDGEEELPKAFELTLDPSENGTPVSVRSAEAGLPDHMKRSMIDRCLPHWPLGQYVDAEYIISGNVRNPDIGKQVPWKIPNKGRRILPGEVDLELNGNTLFLHTEEQVKAFNSWLDSQVNDALNSPCKVDIYCKAFIDGEVQMVGTDTVVFNFPPDVRFPPKDPPNMGKLEWNSPETEGSEFDEDPYRFYEGDAHKERHFQTSNAAIDRRMAKWVRIKREEERKKQEIRDYKRFQYSDPFGRPRYDPMAPVNEDDDNPMKTEVYLYIRPAKLDDIDMCNEIYGWWGRNTIDTPHQGRESIEYLRKVFTDCEAQGLPFLVACSHKNKLKNRRRKHYGPQVYREQVLGFAFAKPFRPDEPAFKRAVEMSVYVDHDLLQMGIGKNLIDRMLPCLDAGWKSHCATDFFLDDHSRTDFMNGGPFRARKIIVNVYHEPTTREDVDEFMWKKRVLEQFGFLPYANFYNICNKEAEAPGGFSGTPYSMAQFMRETNNNGQEKRSNWYPNHLIGLHNVVNFAV